MAGMKRGFVGLVPVPSCYSVCHIGGQLDKYENFDAFRSARAAEMGVERHGYGKGGGGVGILGKTPPNSGSMSDFPPLPSPSTKD